MLGMSASYVNGIKPSSTNKHGMNALTRQYSIITATSTDSGSSTPQPSPQTSQSQVGRRLSRANST